MAWRFFGEFVIARGVFEAALVVLAGMAGLAALGAVKASFVFYGFLNTLNGGMTLALVPEGVRLYHRPDRLRELMASASLAAAVLAAIWLAAGLLLPDRIGRLAFASTWDEGHALLVPMGLAMVARALKHGAFVGLRSLADANRSFRARVVTAPYEVICPIAGAVLYGATGFVVGFMVSQGVAVFVWWREFRSALRRPSDQPAMSQPAVP